MWHVEGGKNSFIKTRSSISSNIILSPFDQIVCGSSRLRAATTNPVLSIIVVVQKGGVTHEGVVFGADRSVHSGRHDGRNVVRWSVSWNSCIIPAEHALQAIN